MVCCTPFNLHKICTNCFLTGFGNFAAGATSEVLDADDSPVEELYNYPPSSPELQSSSANDTAVNSAGMQSMTSNVTEGHTNAICKDNAFLLSLQLGQNDFSVVVTAPDMPEQASICP